MTRIYIDNQPFDVDSQDNLLAAMLTLAKNVPYFCWHPALGSVGACRQCAVTQFQDENDTRGRLIMACMTPVTEDMRIGLTNDMSKDFREQIIASLMTNHPHDCPVCAEGGECHLQDMTVMTGHNKREYQGKKRTHQNQNLGPLVKHEMNRCISCYRCVRYYRDYAGGEDLNVFASSNRVYFGRQCDGTLESQFSGNLVEVCPTGVFTDKPFGDHYSRKWDLQAAPSICQHCSVGCNTSTGERYGSVRRVVNRYNPDLNSYFLCDKGRYGFAFVNSSKRYTDCQGLSLSEFIDDDKRQYQSALNRYRGKSFIGIGSARTSLENNIALKHFVGATNFCSGWHAEIETLARTHEYIAANTPLASLKQIEQADAIVILGEDIGQTAPRMALAVRQALRNLGFAKAERLRVPKWQDASVRQITQQDYTPLYVLQTHTGELSSSARQVLTVDPERLTLLTDALKEKVSGAQTSHKLTAIESDFIQAASASLKQAKRPLIVCGWQLARAQTLMGSGDIHAALSDDAMLAIASRQHNDVGLARLIDEDSVSVDDVIQRLQQDSALGLIVLENSLDSLTIQQRQALMQAASDVVILDHLKSPWHDKDHVVLATTAYTEMSGYSVNYQGRAQRFSQNVIKALPQQSAWKWLAMLDAVGTASNLSKAEHENDLHHLQASMDTDWPLQALLVGQDQQVARQPHRYSGRTAMYASEDIHEPRSKADPQSELRFSMEGLSPEQSTEMPFTWAPGWNSNQSIHKYQQKVGGEMQNSTPPVSILSPAKASMPQIAKSSGTGTAIFVVDYNAVFGGDVLSGQAYALAERTAISSVSASSATLDSLELTDARHLAIDFGGEVLVFEVKVNAQVAAKTLLVHRADGQKVIANSLDAGAVSLASESQVSQFLAMNNQNKQDTALEKQYVLQRLKRQDQHIQIRVISGEENG